MSLTIKEIPFFKGLSAVEVEAVKQCLREKSFKKGEALFMEGASCQKIFFVRSGRVKLVRTASSGREQILETLASGDTCACNPGATVWQCSTTAVALTPCTAWFLSRENYVRLVQTNAKLSQALNRLFAGRLQCFSQLIEEVSLKSSKKRLIRFLLDMLSEGGDTLSIRFTREELAQRTGMARETAARQLYQLKRKKLIDIKPHQITILDKTGLEKLL